MKINMHIVYDVIEDMVAEKRCRDWWELNLTDIRFYSPNEDNGSISSFLFFVEEQDMDAFLAEYPFASFIYRGDKGIDQLHLNDSVDVMRLADNYELPDVFEVIREYLSKLNNWYEELLISIIKDRPLQKVLEIGSRMIKNPIAIHDTYSMYVTHAGTFPDDYHDPIWDDIWQTGLGFSRCVGEALGLDPRLSRKNVSHLTSTNAAESPLEAVTVDIVSHGKNIGYLASTSVWGPFTIGQISLLVILAESMGNMNGLAVKIGKNQDDMDWIAEQLISGEVVDPYAFDHAAEYHDLKGYSDQFVVMTIDMKTAEINGRALGDQWKLHSSYLKTIKRESSSNEITLLHDSHMVIVFPIQHLMVKSILHEIERIRTLFAPLVFSVGVSEPFDDFLSIAAFYRQASVSLYIGRRLNPEEDVYFFKDYALEYLFDEAPFLEQESFCCWATVKLAEYDKKHKTEYLTIMNSLITHNGNLSKTAEELFIHRNTLVYKIKKMEEYLGISSIEMLDWAYFQLSYRIMKWNEKKYKSLE